jgi:2',3'-cyclic-nucleotide 2'-phosphodiesterase (5'-nucleotidase family)
MIKPSIADFASSIIFASMIIKEDVAMKALIRRWMVLFLSLTVLVSFAPDVLAAEKILTILHVNDTHSHLDAFGPKNADLTGTKGGIAKAAAVIDAEKRSGSKPLLLHAGDSLPGTSSSTNTQAVAELQLLDHWASMR